MDSKLLSEIRTKDEANEVIDELELLKNSLYEDGERSFNSTLNNNVRYWVADIIKDETRSLDIEKYLNELINNITQLNEFKLTLAFEPSSTGINMFLDYIRQNVDQNLILDIEHDPTILGGTIISYKGKYHDFSLVRIFDKEFEDKRDDFLSLIEHKLGKKEVKSPEKENVKVQSNDMQS